MVQTASKSKEITILLNGTISAIKEIIQVNYKTEKPRLATDHFHIHYGVLIGITGALSGKMIFSGHPDMFAYLGQSLFGMPLEGEMLTSFSGELGNMIAGSVATTMANEGVQVDITAPMLMNGETQLSGYAQAIHMGLIFPGSDQMSVYLVMDNDK